MGVLDAVLVQLPLAVVVLQEPLLRQLRFLAGPGIVPMDHLPQHLHRGTVARVIGVFLHRRHLPDVQPPGQGGFLLRLRQFLLLPHGQPCPLSVEGQLDREGSLLGIASGGLPLLLGWGYAI
eukprot:5087485-Alexandrium_andersonii.AAC.1